MKKLLIGITAVVTITTILSFSNVNDIHQSANLAGFVTDSIHLNFR